MGAAAPALFAAGVGLQIYGGIQQARALREQGRAQRAYYGLLADQSESDAKDVLAAGDRQATDVQDAAARQAADLERKRREVAGAQRATLSANGVGSGSVTAEDIARDTASRAALDEMVIRFNADSQTYETRLDAENRASQLRKNAIFQRGAGVSAFEASKTAARASLLGSATQVSQNWANWLDTGRGSRTTPGRG